MLTTATAVDEAARYTDIAVLPVGMRGGAGQVEQLARLDVVGGGCRVALHDQHGGDDADDEGASDDVDEVQGAGDPGQLAPLLRLVGFGRSARALHRARTRRDDVRDVRCRPCRRKDGRPLRRPRGQVPWCTCVWTRVKPEPITESKPIAG